MANWQQKDKLLRGILKKHDDPDNELESVSNTKKELIPHLRTSPMYRLLPRSVVQMMEKATTFHSFNQALDGVFDFADDNLIWIEM